MSVKWTLLAALLVSALLAACGGDDGDADEILPGGAGDPRAYTERYLHEHPRAVLRISHLLVAEVDPAAGADRFAYQIDEPLRLRLEVEPGTEVVEALVLRDARGSEVGRSGSAQVSLLPGRHELEIRPPLDGAGSERRTVFVRPTSAADGSVTLSAGSNCINCSFDGAQLDGQDFDDVDLSGSSFTDAGISDSTFRGATMVNCFLSGAVEGTFVEGCDFTGADLTGSYLDWTNIGQQTTFGGPVPTPPANLSNTSWGGVLVEDDTYAVGQLENVVFANARMTGAKFTGPTLENVDFRGADLSGSDFTATGPLVVGGSRQTLCDPCDFSVEPSSGNRTRLRNAVLSRPASNPVLILAGSSLRGADLSGAQLEGGGFDGLDLSGVDFTQANLKAAQLAGADLSDADLSGAQFDGAVLDDADLSGTRVDGASFAQASLQGVDLYARDLHGLNLSSASLRGSILDFCDLAGADLSGAMLGVPAGSTQVPASMFGAYMPNVDLTGADLRGVDLSRAHIYGDAGETSLDQALLDGARLVDAICSGTQFTEASLRGAVLDGAQLVDCTFVGADLSNASLDTTYLQGADFSAAASVSGVSLSNAAVSTMPGEWTFTEQNGMPFVYSYGATELGGIATQTDVVCPDAEPGPCVGDKLTPIANGPFPPQPTCIPSPPTYNNCTAPAPPTPTPPP
jgi:uncharacterized protein YjbI with pentapeptide repeats